MSRDCFLSKISYLVSMRYLALYISLFFMSSLTAQVDWGIGTKWTYEGINYDSIVGKEVYEPVEYEIIDTLTINGVHCFKMDYGSPFDYFYLYIEANDVFFFNEILNDFVRYYSFDNDLSFMSTQHYWRGEKIDYQITIDTSYQEIVNGNVLTVREYTYPDSDSLVLPWPSPMLIYDFIGRKNWSIVPHPIAPATIGTYAFGDIRCFENKGQVINFKGYDCDSIFALTTSVQDPYVDLIKVSPNPSSGEVMISNAEGSPYMVINALGQVVQQGVLDGQHIVITSAGLYSIVLEYEGVRIARQVVVR